MVSVNALPNSKLRPGAPNKALQACIDRIEGLNLHPDADPVLLAVSGGADSMAMAHAFGEWRRRHAPGARLRALVVDHGLRPGSAREAAGVVAALAGLGIDAAVAAVTDPPPRAGIQAWARRQRYRLLVQNAAPDDAVIATAHHSGDQAETVMMRANRGSGVAGLAGIARESSIDGVRLCRPFLDLGVGTLRASLEGSGVATVDDPSNLDRRFERVRIRRGLAESGIGPQLCRLSVAAGRLNDALLSGIGASMAGRAGVSPMGYAWIDHGAFADLPDTAAETLLSHFIRAMACVSRPVGRAGIARLAEALRQRRVATLGGCEWRSAETAAGGRIVCHAEAERLPPATAWQGGFHLHDGRWQVFAPDGFRGKVEAIGAKRFAALRRLHPRWAPPEGVPARAFWRIPVLTGGGHSRRSGLPEGAATLDDSTIVPHVIEYGSGEKRPQDKLPAMRFAGGRGALRDIGI